MTPAPPAVAELLRLIGEAGALALIEAHGGTRITIPAGANTNLARLLGEDAAAALHAHFGHERVTIPLAKAWCARAYREQGLSYAAIARKLRCTEATVWKHLNPEGGAQLRLAL